jgi:hypothetical protein
VVLLYWTGGWRGVGLRFLGRSYPISIGATSKCQCWYNNFVLERGVTVCTNDLLVQSIDIPVNNTHDGGNSIPPDIVGAVVVQQELIQASRHCVIILSQDRFRKSCWI